MMKNEEWLQDRIAYLKGFKSLNNQQELLLLLAETNDRSVQQQKQLDILVKAEKAAITATKARLKVTAMMNVDKKAERKARDHALYNAAGLLILAGLVDTKTGLPMLDRGELLGALLGLAQVPESDPRRSEWRRVGSAKLAEQKSS